MSSLKPFSSYTAAEISAASKFSPALSHYLGFNFSSPQAPRHEIRTKAWISSAAATILNSETPHQVCKTWSQIANEILQSVFQECFKDSEVALFALGKLGAQELNLSSDVDILVVSRKEDANHLKALRQFQKILSERTPRGFLFRVDFDLRPGGRQGPLIPTVDQFEDYYGNYGETWERLAFVRLLGIAGDTTLISQILGFAKKFTYRRHLDYTLLQDLKSMRGKIRQHYSPHSTDSVWDLKLGVGGIRDVELFTHAMQVIHGGKNPKLQVHSTAEALELLEEAGILPVTDAKFLVNHYWQLRQLENFVQAQNDEQTHLLEKTAKMPDWASQILVHLNQDLEHCDHVVSSLLGKSSDKISIASTPAGLQSATSREVWQEILQIEVLSRNKERDEQARLQFLNEFYETLEKQKGDTDKALQHLKEFIKSTRAKASFFTLLVRNKNLMDELAWLFGHSPYLSQILSSRPELIDSYVYRSQELQKEDLALLLEQLAEKRLLGEIINGSHYLEDKNLGELQANLSATADEITSTLLAELKKEYPSELEVLCLGKWGGKELGFRSDLDFIFIVPQDPTENDSKLARRFINRLTETRKGGSIYAIDTRLKPSGKAGPFVISEAQLMEYLDNEAQAWERQAYLKSRKLSSGMSIVMTKKLTPAELEELEKIREGLVRYDPASIDLKYAEGAMLDIELFSQTEILAESLSVKGPSTLDFLSVIANSDGLQRNYLRLRQIEQMLQLVSTEGGAKVVLNHESFQQLAKALQRSPEDLKTELNSLISENLQILNQLDRRRRSKILKTTT